MAVLRAADSRGYVGKNAEVYMPMGFFLWQNEMCVQIRGGNVEGGRRIPHCTSNEVSFEGNEQHHR